MPRVDHVKEDVHALVKRDHTYSDWVKPIVEGEAVRVTMRTHVVVQTTSYTHRDDQTCEHC